MEVLFLFPFSAAVSLHTAPRPTVCCPFPISLMFLFCRREAEKKNPGRASPLSHSGCCLLSEAFAMKETFLRFSPSLQSFLWPPFEENQWLGGNSHVPAVPEVLFSHISPNLAFRHLLEILSRFLSTAFYGSWWHLLRQASVPVLALLEGTCLSSDLVGCPVTSVLWLAQKKL